MNSEPRPFVLQARDPEHGCPVFEARFPVAELDDLRALIGADADDDPELEHSYMLDAAETAAVAARFGVVFDPEGREVRLWPWNDQWGSMRRVPYVVHGGYELPLLLEGRKLLADMSDAYPPHQHFNEDRRRMRFGCVPICCAVSTDDLAWIDAAGYRALPPLKGPVLSVSLLYDLPDDDAARRLLDDAGAAALVRFSVRTRPFLDLTDGQTPPDYAIPAAYIGDLNRNIEGHIEVVAHRFTALSLNCDP